MDPHHDEESRPLLNEHLNEPHYENEDEQENNIITPCKKISKLNKILISVIIGLIVLLSTFVGKLTLYVYIFLFTNFLY